MLQSKDQAMKALIRNKSLLLTLLPILIIVVVVFYLSLQKPVILENTTAVSTPTLSNLAIPFIANHGQIDDTVAYYANTFIGNVFVTKQGELVYSLSPNHYNKVKDKVAENPRWTLTETLVGAKPQPTVEQQSATKVSYFIGNDPSQWHSDIKTHSLVNLGEVWPGIRVEYLAKGYSVEKLFTLAPGADADAIRIKMHGANKIQHQDNGALNITTGIGDVQLSAPMAWQEYQEKNRPVTVAYVLYGQEYGFKLGKYNPSLPVMIDPLLQATYLGGTGNDLAWSMAINPVSGKIYVAGETESADFPGTTGGAQTTLDGTTDLFIARFNAELTILEQATYLGGSGDDGGDYIFDGLTLSAATGDVYIAAGTESLDFPGTSGGAFPNRSGTYDAAVAQLNSDLTTLIQSTYYGGSGVDGASIIEVHPVSGDVYIAGFTWSVVPDTAGGAQPTPGDSNPLRTDSFVAQFSSDLQNVKQATYLGGSENDGAWAMAINPVSGDIYVTGQTTSPDLPGTTGGAQDTLGGADGFVVSYSADLTTLQQATFIGGSMGEQALDIAIQPTSGEIYVAGYTTSFDLPATTGGFQETNISNDAGFITRINASLTSFLQSTYLSGTGYEDIYTIAIQPSSNEVYVTGVTSSSDFPGTSGGFQPNISIDQSDSFIARLSDDLTALNQATYIGGDASDNNSKLVIHPSSGDIYITGFTGSTNFPGTIGGAQATYPGGYVSTMVARFDSTLTGVAVPDINATPASHNFGQVTVGNSSAAVEFIFANLGSAALIVTNATLSDTTNYSLDLFGGSNPCQNVPGALTPGESCTITISFAPGSTGAKPATFTVTSNDPDEATFTIPLSGIGVAVIDPDIAVMPASINFGDVKSGEDSSAHVVTVTNNGSLNLDVSDCLRWKRCD